MGKLWNIWGSIPTHFTNQEDSWRGRVNGVLIHTKFISAWVHRVSSEGQKPHIWPIFGIFGDPYPPPSPIWGNFGVRQRTRDKLFHEKFTLIEDCCSPIAGENLQIWLNFEYLWFLAQRIQWIRWNWRVTVNVICFSVSFFIGASHHSWRAKIQNLTKIGNLGLSHPPPVLIMAKFGVREWRHDIFTPNFIFIGASCRPQGKENQNWPYFQIQRYVMTLPSRVETKLNTDASLQTLVYPNIKTVSIQISKLFLNSNGLMVIPLAQTWPFKKHEKQKKTKTVKIFHTSPTIVAVR